MASKKKETNLKQKDFYENKRKNFATKIWSKIRNGLLTDTRKLLGFERQILDLHKSWSGDLSSKKVLDLGCYKGNSLSYYFAENSKKYIAIDLSEKGIAHLNNRIKHFDNTAAYAIDFTSDDFREGDFDLIYAYGVLHHFKNTEELIEKLNQKLASNGQIISYDPLETNFLLKILRSIYRPFQTDKDWEWPFSKNVYYQFENAFKIKERRAMLGKAKWFFVVNFLPLSAEKKLAIGKRWHREDWERSRDSDPYMFRCMHLTMLMQKKD